jgi:hypothetical protein
MDHFVSCIMPIVGCLDLLIERELSKPEAPENQAVDGKLDAISTKTRTLVPVHPVDISCERLLTSQFQIVMFICSDLRCWLDRIEKDRVGL